ncbi:hydantoinase B/oxoprolinase family protein [Mycolicibacterium hodleri]|uniref:Hydantoinase B/oxoprolinase family protein n=1 Tax=Mycolicibacterium hodleri TaxID=49897 RepID=A0A502E7Q9_9MYCO|nr:hydantoinase B/oxoprolinase family protein [Mycolicibacterium hodleri]TPG32481.1 hydantoinase B/oxoprolinase family protein [Mycolicibacterium hodleri]
MNEAEPRTVDPLESEIFRYTTQSITEELEINITRTAYSPLIREIQDYAVALVNTDFLPYTQSNASIPIFVTDMGEPVREAVSTIGIENLEPGDVFVINSGSGQHLNNTVLGTPLYHGEVITGYLAIRSHWADVGGLVPGGQAMGARSIFHEGTRYHGLRIMRRGEIVPEVLATIQVNTYQKEMLTGDMMAQLSACMLGARRWQERVVPRWDADAVKKVVDAQLAASTEYARRIISELPDGTATTTHEWQFTQGGVRADLKFSLTLTVEGDRMVVDMSGMPPQSELPLNAGAIGGGLAAAKLAFRYLVAGDVPTDAGFFAPLEIQLPAGTIVSATGDAPMAYWNTTLPLIIDMFLRAVGQLDPERVPAAHYGSVGGLMLYGPLPDGSWWRSTEAAPGGLGAESDADGYGPVKCLILGNTKNSPIEMIEARFPLRYHSMELRRDSGGAGRHRGGPGTSKVIEVLEDVWFDAYAEPSMGAPGLAGGKPGSIGSVHVKTPDSVDWAVPEGSNTGVSSLKAGTLIRHVSGGGGGWGTPPDEDTQTSPDATAKESAA